MSVINKMLRDLDQRQDAHAPTAAPAPAASVLRHGTASVSFGKPAAQRTTRRPGLWLGMGALVLAGVCAGAWLWWQNQGASTGVDIAAPPAATVALPASAPAVAASVASVAFAASAPADPPTPPASDAGAVAAAPAVAASPTPGATATAMTLRMESSLSARQAMDALLSTPAPSAAPVAVAAPAPTPAPAPAPTAPAVTERPKARTAPHPAVASPTPASETTVQRQQQAGGDAIAQAQNLWNSGSHDAAIDLVQQSIAAAERSAKAGTPSGAANALLVPLVREMARMQLAEARFGAVWEMLTRLEPLLGNQADLWAIRANAAQRLGRHQDSVHAYMMALQSRPDEQRWLLGTAVSLAALGQTSSAAEMAEKARALGPVSKDILAYLRQNGVPLRDQ